MFRKRFGLIGDGIIAAKHRDAIKSIGGEINWVYDPIYKSATLRKKSEIQTYYDYVPFAAWRAVDWVVICSPTYMHRSHVKTALHNCKQVICEKPLCLPWEPLIDDDRINIVLQLRWIKDLPKKAELVRAVMVRDEAFFKTWKGNPKLAGGNIYEFYIHYIDLAIRLGASFEGAVLPKGNQSREIISRGKVLDIMKIDMQDCYNRMYEDILNGKGVKPKELFYLTWTLNKYSERYGYRNAGINTPVRMDKELL